MISSSVNLATETTIALFQALHNSGINYAVLRNYEQFPAFSHDIDLVISSKDVAQWRSIISELALKFKWSAVTECDHWAKSSVRSHNIEIFRFYHLPTRQYLQIDLFHGYLLWGLPLLEESELLESKLWDNRGFYRIDPFMENMFRMLQLSRLLSIHGSQHSKVLRYKGHLLSVLDSEATPLIATSQKHLGPVAEKAWQMLKADRLEDFQKQITALKSRYLLARLSRKPLLTFRHILARGLDYYSNFIAYPCGRVLPVFCSTPDKLETLRECLRKLQEAGIIYQWYDANANRKSVSIAEHKVLERGGLVLKWQASRQGACLELDQSTSPEVLERQLIELSIQRHPCLYFASAQSQYQDLPA